MYMRRLHLLLLLVLPAYVGSTQPVADTLVPVSTIQYPLKEPRKKVWVHAGLAAGYTGATYFFFRKQDSHFREESQEHKSPFLNGIAGAVSPLGESKNAWRALGATTGLAYLSRSPRLQHAVFVWAGSLLVNGVVTDKLKNSFQRYRPNTGMPYNTFDGHAGPHINHSLPSAHTSNAFTTATVFATLYKDKKWVPPLAYGVAALVGASRVYNNAHWMSDVMAGAAVGFLSAKAMISTDKWLSKKGILLYPQVGRRGASLGMVKSF
jgi:membrane-associated phospholipid phosphatase